MIQKRRNRLAEHSTDITAAKEYAFKALSIRPHASEELREKLQFVGFEKPVVSSVIERLFELGYLDDVAFVKMYVGTKHASGWGKNKILSALDRKQISTQIVEDSLELLSQEGFDGFSAEEQKKLASCYARKIGAPTSRKERDRLARRLFSKGFSSECIFDVMEELK